MTNQRDQKVTLSICIPTLNRADFISETLDSITSQLQDDVEIVIVDGGSIDNTEAIIKQYKAKFSAIHYHKKAGTNNTPSNEGFDRDCSLSVELANGEYCWLMTDDDLLKPQAIHTILHEIKNRHDLIVVNSEIANVDISQVLLAKRPDIESDLVFQPTTTDWNAFAAKAGNHITFVGAIVIRRSLWLERNKSDYFGSGFVHVGVILQQPLAGNILLMANPLVVIRYGNAHWSNRAFKIWMYDWPKMIWSFPALSDEARTKITYQYPWKKSAILLKERTFGHYSIRQFNDFLAPTHYSLVSKQLAKIIAVLPRRPLYYLGLIFIYLSARNIKLNKFRLLESWGENHV